MASFGVVAVLEFVQLGLKFRDGGDFGLLGKEFFQGLMESFNFSLGLGMSRRTVFLDDAEFVELVFELVTSMLETCGVDDSVIGQGGLWWAIGAHAGEKVVDNYGSCDALECCAAEKETGMVVQPVQNLHVTSIR